METFSHGEDCIKVNDRAISGQDCEQQREWKKSTLCRLCSWHFKGSWFVRVYYGQNNPAHFVLAISRAVVC
jgi:hypothetical protein